MEDEYINLDLGEPKAPLRNSLKNALIEGVNKNEVGYTAPIGDKRAREVSAKILNTSTSKTFMSCGSSGGLVITLKILCKQHSNVMILSPYYPQFISWINVEPNGWDNICHVHMGSYWNLKYA